MNSWMTRAAGPLALTAVLLAGCGGVSGCYEGARSAQRKFGAAGTTDDRQLGAGCYRVAAGERNLEHARQAVKDGKEQPAERYAQLAQLDAELAVSKSQSCECSQGGG